VTLEDRVLEHLVELAEGEGGFRVGPPSVARELGESEEDVETALQNLVERGLVKVFPYQGQDWWGVR